LILKVPAAVNLLEKDVKHILEVQKNMEWFIIFVFFVITVWIRDKDKIYILLVFFYDIVKNIEFIQ